MSRKSNILNRIKSAPPRSRRLPKGILGQTLNPNKNIDDDDDFHTRYDDMDYDFKRNVESVHTDDHIGVPNITHSPAITHSTAIANNISTPDSSSKKPKERRRSSIKKKKKKKRKRKSVEIKTSKGLDINAFVGASVAHQKRELKDTSPVLGMDVTVEPGQGLQISTCEEHLPVHNAGLRPGDLIVLINGKFCDDKAVFLKTIGVLEPGDDLMLKVKRGNDVVTVRVVVGAHGYTEEQILKIRQMSAKDHIKPSTRLEEIERARIKLKNMKVCLGMVIKAVPHESKGLAVESVDLDGPAGKAGILKADIIIEMKERRITDTTTFFDIYQKLEAGEKVRFKVIRNGVQKKINVRLGANGFSLKEVKKIYTLAKSTDPEELRQKQRMIMSPELVDRTLSSAFPPEKEIDILGAALASASISMTTATTTATTTTAGTSGEFPMWTDLGD